MPQSTAIDPLPLSGLELPLVRAGGPGGGLLAIAVLTVGVKGRRLGGEARLPRDRAGSDAVRVCRRGA